MSMADAQPARLARRRPPATVALLLPVADPATSRLTTSMIASMVFLGALVTLVTFSAGLVAWQAARDVSESLTVELPATTAADEVAAAEQTLRTITGVVSVRVLSVSETRALLEPWLGTDRLEDILLPRLIAVTVPAGSFPLASSAIENAVRPLAPAAIVIDHRRVAAEAGGLMELTLAVGGTLVLVLVVALSVATRALTRAAVASQSATIEVLQILGTPDDQIAGAFSRRIRQAASAGAAVAVVLAATVAIGIVVSFWSAFGPLTTAWTLVGAALAISLPGLLSVLLCTLQANAAARKALREPTAPPGTGTATSPNAHLTVSADARSS